MKNLNNLVSGTLGPGPVLRLGFLFLGIVDTCCSKKDKMLRWYQTSLGPSWSVQRAFVLVRAESVEAPSQHFLLL